ncbi:MAG: coproporphyrinogen dehydrogenase HemZ [Lachnospiraceae bacterium]|nr:coproporphyrinogen dehydrogenase HemZ [Lachnospiraceae bacterium]
MITMTIWGEDFEQEVRPLIKSFYPGEEFQVTKKEESTLSAETIRTAEQFKELLVALPEEEQPAYAFCLRKTEGVLAVRADGVWYADAFAGVPENAERRIYKDCLMRKLYLILQKLTGKTLPWGIMTGIRPTKQVLERLEEGESAEQIRSFLKEEYYCTDEKIETSLTVAKKEHEILTELDYRNGYSVYIGIPFCPSTCYYCSFPSFPIKIHGHLMEAYLAALKKEIQYAATAIPGKKLQSIYIGGGTPTTLSAEQLDDLFTAVENAFDLSHLKEYTVEAGRPDSITPEKLQAIKRHGIPRISINPQTMKQETLDLIGRKHTVEQIEETFYQARELGFENINMDMIIGLAKETPADVALTLERIGRLSPDNLTVHTLAVKRAARLNTNREDYADMAAENVQEMLRLTYEFAKAQNYHPYYLYRQKNMTENLENIGYSRPGKEGIYNILIMEERQTILALGAGATSKFVFREKNQLERVENVKSLKDYIERTDEMIERKKRFLEEFGDRL